MYNSNIQTNNELPSTAKLIKSTVLALIVAFTLLITVVMPAEYAVDPTGLGRVFGLVEMGDVKSSLHKEAESDALAHSVSEQNKDEITPKSHSHGNGQVHSH